MPSLEEERKRDQGDEDWWSTGHLSADDECWEELSWSTGQLPAFEDGLERIEWSTGHDMDANRGRGWTDRDGSDGFSRVSDLQVETIGWN